MAIGIIVALILIGAIVGCSYGIYKSNKHKLGVGIFTAMTIVLVLTFILIPFSFHTVNSGEVAVVKNLGKLTDVRTAGTNFDLWITKTYQKYDTKVQNVDIQTAAYSSDAQTMDIALTLQYQIMSDKVIEIATEYGSLETLQSRIMSIATEKTKSVLSSYKAMEIIADRASISPAVEQTIMDAIGDEYFVNVNAVVLTNIDFSDAFELAVEEKMIAEQAKLKADYENQTKIAQAEADAQAKLKAAEAEIEIAKANAEALAIEAEAQSAANNKISSSLTDKVLQSQFYEKWNGVLPSVMTDGSTIVDIGKVEQ